MFSLIRRDERHGYTHAPGSLYEQTRRGRREKEGGGQQKAAAAPPEPGLNTRTPRRSVPANSRVKLGLSGPNVKRGRGAVVRSTVNSHFAPRARSDSCCLGATSVTRWRTRPCQSAECPAHYFCSVLRTKPLCVPVTRFI